MDFDDFFELDPMELAMAMGFAEEIAEEEHERLRAQRDFETDVDPFNDEDEFQNGS